MQKNCKSLVVLLSLTLAQSLSHAGALDVSQIEERINAQELVVTPEKKKVLIESEKTMSKAFLDYLKSKGTAMPYFFMVPREHFLKNPSAKAEATLANPALIANLMRPANSDGYNDNVGLRVVGLNGALSPKDRAEIWAKSKMITDGDIVLSFRPEWFGSLKYSHVQLGTSHAALAYIDKDADGKERVHNVDMPLDFDTYMSPNGENYFSSKHYVESPWLHVVRPLALHDGKDDEQERKNVKAWLKKIVENMSPKNTTVPKMYPAKMTFNKDYGSPNVSVDAAGKIKSMTFVADLARMAFGKNPKTADLKMFCSEFVWSLLSLKNCDPTNPAVASAFLNEDVPSCVNMISSPLPVLGNLTTAQPVGDSLQTLDGLPLSVGMADGPVLLADSMSKNRSAGQRLAYRNSLLTEVMTSAVGVAKNISSGHKAVEDGLLKSNPKFFELLLKYYQDVGSVTTSEPKDITFTRFGFNGMQMGPEGLTPPAVNYSPTSYMVHSLLAPGVPLKSYGYVSTVFLAPADAYVKAREAMKNALK